MTVATTVFFANVFFRAISPAQIAMIRSPSRIFPFWSTTMRRSASPSSEIPRSARASLTFAATTSG